MRKISLILVIVTSLSATSFGQNVPRYSQINFAQGVNNPAALALDSKVMVDMIYHNQWLGFEGAPNTGGINAQYELYHDMAVGLVASYDLIGVHHATQVSGQYAYRVFTQNDNAWIFGASVGIDQRVHDLASAQTTDPDDPAFSTSYSKLRFNSGFGVYYYAPNFYFSASIPQFFQNTFRTQAFNIPGWHYYMATGVYLHAKGGNYTFNPNIQIKSVMNAPIQGDISLRNTFNNAFSLVVGYRSENAIMGGFDFLIGGRYRMGYSFSHDVGPLARTKGGSHELYMGIGLPYHNSRENFGQGKYINKKGKIKRDFHKGYKHRSWFR